ncbi:hypothetical protein MGSAQ_000445 [marine sediment metagenome]|uniref:Uncharacterized protein n=1 Tax=marine sediment metagenome TaxID=412755 RepID=A0A1B6NX78_9ZZZZ
MARGIKTRQLIISDHYLGCLFSRGSASMTHHALLH